MDCLFCKIIKGEVPSQKVYEDDKCFAFLDINPVNKGHTLVVHKQHSKDLFDSTPEMLRELITCVQKVSKAVKEGVNADGINIGQSNGSDAGQVIFHLHFHIMPRFKNDGRKLWHGDKASEEELKEVKERVVSQL